MNKKVLIIPSLVLIFSLFFSACGSKVFYEKIDPIENETWNINDVLTYEIQIEDTLQYYNMYVNIRNSVDFETQNFYVFMKTQFPDGFTAQDTLGCILSDPYGKWTGKGMGRLKDNRFLLKPKVRFPMKGTYRFEVRQGMRTDHVKGVANFGLSLYYFEKDK